MTCCGLLCTQTIEALQRAVALNRAVVPSGALDHAVVPSSAVVYIVGRGDMSLLTAKAASLEVGGASAGVGSIV